MVKAKAQRFSKYKERATTFHKVVCLSQITSPNTRLFGMSMLSWLAYPPVLVMTVPLEKPWLNCLKISS